MKQIKIILGTAHLSSTPGKRSPDGKFREYVYSRKVCKAVQEELLSRGVDCVIDYEDNDMPGLTSSQELIKRVKIVNEIAKKTDCLYISIHVNASAKNGWDKATGFAIYTSPGETKSDTLATDIFDAATKLLKPIGKKFRKDMSDGDPDYEENFYVLRKTSCPAVLTENFFQNSKSDVEWLESEEGFKAVVTYHVNGILKYLNRE